MDKKNVQMNLTAQVEKKFTQYEAGDGSDWRVDRWPELKRAFSLRENELRLWHEELAGQGRAWVVARRLFGVFPLLGAESDDFKTWSSESLGKSLGISSAKVEMDLDAAVEFWNKRKKLSSLEAKVEKPKSASGVIKPSGDDMDMVDIPSIYKVIDDDTVERILTAYGFSHVKGESTRLEVADRLLSLKRQFEQPNTRAMARQLVNMELAMATYEAVIIGIKNDLELLDTQVGSKDERRKLAGEMAEYEKRLGTLSEKYSKLLSDIGGDELDLEAQKRLSVDQLSFFLEGIREYHADGNRQLIDGVFTADEIQWLLTPTKMRDPQYRMDFVAVMNDAMRPENLWDRDYVPSPVQRSVCRQLHKVIESMVEISDDEEIVEGVDDVEFSEDEDGLSDLSEVVEGEVMDSDSGGVKSEHAVESMAVSRRGGGDGDECIGVN